MSEFPIAKVDALFLADSEDSFTTVLRQHLDFDLDGIVGDQRHRGREMLADVRIKSYVKKGSYVLNRQTVSLIDADSVEHIANQLEIDPKVVEERYNISRMEFIASCIGANILLGGFRGSDRYLEFYELPNATDFGPYDEDNKKFNDVSLMITRYNPPCIHPGHKIEELYPGARRGTAQQFVRAAEGRRGFVAMTVKPGRLTVGDEVMFRPLPTAR